MHVVIQHCVFNGVMEKRNIGYYRKKAFQDTPLIKIYHTKFSQNVLSFDWESNIFTTLAFRN